MSALGACQNAATVTLKCAKYKESHFKAGRIEERKKRKRPAGRCATVRGLFQAQRTVLGNNAGRAPPSGGGRGGAVLDRSPALLALFFFSRSFLKANGKEAGREIKWG